MPVYTSIKIKEGTICISPHAFSGCSNLMSIAIPNSVTSIGYNAFEGSPLTSITIGNSVTSIDAWGGGDEWGRDVVGPKFEYQGNK